MPLTHTDRNAGSVTRDLVETVGRELAALYEQLEAIYESGFIETGEPRRWWRRLGVVVVAIVGGRMRRPTQETKGSRSTGVER